MYGPAHLCVECHCVMLTIYTHTTSFGCILLAKPKPMFFSFSAKWYNLASIFIAENRMHGPVIHASRPGPHNAQALCFTGLNVPK